MSLKPCPFCPGGTTEIRENGKVWTGQKYSTPISVSVVHHCEPVEGQPSRPIERIGRDEASAIAAWNRRAIPAGYVLAESRLIRDVIEKLTVYHKQTGGRYEGGAPCDQLTTQLSGLLAAAKEK